ncbi:hypothetical protein H310_07568 [Aphanomyces invadans]|uniref:Calmodulin n=1 Tax=Aphanomyces invadans TaxID=157072 RepID=A0A024U3F8_9STRA|nr:hypothetical protein H310_07568 [Aphanomyces invadans]ETW00163.1 hypothetical protein H310_07568 [Aphanomyces invadans]|eukprot:XP_008871188.1 hypothetical protein H310_07568 [Aphanomyces invadans]
MGPAPSSLRVHGEFRQFVRQWDIMDVAVARMKYKLLTLRFCVNMEQLSRILGRQLPDPLVTLIFQVFAPKSIRMAPTVPVVDVFEVFAGLILVCQATLSQRVASLFDLADVQGREALSSTELSILLCAVARSIVKLTSPPYLIMPETVQQFALSCISDQAKRVDSIDKSTFCTWALNNALFTSYIRVCTGQDLPRLYVGLEKANALVGYIEFDSIPHMQSTSVDGLRKLSVSQLGLVLPPDFGFLSQGRMVAKSKETNVKAWSLIPFAVLGTPGMHVDDPVYRSKALLAGTASNPHPNDRPLQPFQFRYHYHFVESHGLRVQTIQPVARHRHFRLRGERVYWRPSQYWCGDWIVNQSRIASNSRTCLRQKLKKQQLLPSRGMVVKDIYGRIVSNNPKLPHVQSKLRLLALDTQLSNDTSSGDVQASAMIVDMAGDKKMVSRGHSRIVGALRRSKMTQTTKECAKWTVIDARAALPNEWSSTTTSLSLESDQVQGFPVVWIRPLSEPTPPSLDDIDISKKNPTLQNLLQAIIQTLADKRAINAQDVFGRTLMHHAAVYGHYRLLDVLLAEHALVHVTDSQHNTPLHVAASRCRLKEVSALLTNGASTTALNVHHQLPLHLALYSASRQRNKVKSNDVLTKYTVMEQVVDLLWDRTPSEWWHVPDVYGVTIFELEQSIFGDMFEAARAGLVPRIQHLLESKKVRDINTPMSVLQRTALHEACERGRYNACDFFVRHGADVFAQDWKGSTPLHVAAPRGYDKIVELLVHQYPTSTLVQDISGKTALHLAIETSKTSVAMYLIRRMSNLQIQDASGYTPLHVACLVGNKDVIIALLAGGANPSFCRLSIPSPTAGPAKRLKSPHLLGLYWKRRTGTTVVIEHCVECLIRGWAIKLFTPDSATYFDLFKLFLQTDGGWSLHSTDCTNQPMVHHVVARLANNPSIVVQCLEELAKVHLLSINHQDPHGNTLLLQECKRVCFNKTTASLAVVRSLLHHGANLHLANNAQESPMQCAAFFGHDALLELLLDTVTPDFLAKSAQVSNSPLHLACLGGHVSTIQILLSCGAVLNGCAEEPPLCYGIRSGKPDVVQFLLHRGAEVNIWCPLARTIHSFGHVSRLYEPVDMGSPLTLLLHLVPSRVFQLPTYDVPPTQPELLAENQHIYLSKQELAHRDIWRSWQNIGNLLCTKLHEIDSALRVHVYAPDMTRACELGFWAIAHQLLTTRRISFPRICDDVGEKEAIHHAAAAGQTAIVSALVASGVNPNVRVKHITRPLGKRNAQPAKFAVGPLYFAYSRGQLVTAAKLHVLGSTMESLPTLRSSIVLNGGLNGWMKLQYIVGRRRDCLLYSQHANMVRHLEQAVRLQWSLVHVACQRGSLHLLQFYFKAGMSLHDLTPNAGHTPLTLAIQSQQLELVEWICENHPAALQVKAPHLPLPTACGLAANSSVKPALVKLLLHHSLLAVSDAGDDGHQALDRAALVGDSAVVDHLISVAHAKPTIQTVVAALSGQNGDSIARIAASWRSMEGATFDHLLRIFILASSQSQWSLLHHLLMMTEAAVDPVATWIRRAASCCLIMHRAAAANQMEVVKLLLRQGVPADLVVVEIPGTKSPIWYAAIHGALDSFLALVLHLPPTQSCLPALFQHRTTKVALNCLSLPLHSIETTDVVRIDGCEACTWRNLSGLSCYQTDATKPLRIIHRCIQYWIAHIQQQPQNQDNQTLLHLVAKSGDLATVQAVVQSGASLEAMNNYMQSPAMIVAQRRDVTGTRVLEFMWPMLSEDQKAKACQACTQVDPLNLATLRFCLQETKFCKEMTYASSIMSGNKPAVDLLLAAKVPIERTVWQTLVLVLQSRQGKHCQGMVESLLPVLDVSVSLPLVASIASCAANFHWWKIVRRLLQMFNVPLTRALNVSPQETESNGRQSTMHVAVSCGEHHVIQHLLQQGWDLTIDRKGQSPLHVIAWIGDTGLFQLFQRFVSKERLVAVLDTKDSTGYTALHIAAIRGHLAILEAFQAAGASAEIRTAQGWTPALLAAKHNQLHIVMQFVLQKPAHALLETLQGEPIAVVAAKFGAFRIVSWLLLTLNMTPPAVQALVSSDGCTLVHYAALHNQLAFLASNTCLSQCINTKDSYGCLPLHYALMQGRLGVIQYLCWNGAHVHGPIQSPLISSASFDIAMVLTWSPLPGWFSHLLTAPVQVPAQDAPAWKVINPRHVNLRTWNFPTSSLLEFATATGLATTVSFVMSVLRYLPMLCAGTLDVRQRIFMSAVSLNHVDVVDILLTSDVIHVIEDPLDHTQIQCQYFGDFVDIAIQHSAHRGLEAMTLCLLRHWKGSVGLGHGKDTESTADFAFQFAVVLQYACIFGRVNLIRHLVARGGSTILGYRVDEGPALVYAFAFGQLDAVRVLMQLGAEISALDTYHAPSLKRWLEFKEPSMVQIEWHDHPSPPTKPSRRRRKFCGPVERYDVVERLPRDMLEAIVHAFL